ncbi:sugar phosphotransferase, partial [Brevundimonas sp. MYb27]
MVSDLLAVRAALDAAGIDFILVRGNDERPVVAVDWESRKDVREALVSAFRNEPFYS